MRHFYGIWVSIGKISRFSSINIFEKMIQAIDIIQKPRVNLFKLIEGLSIEQLNLVPPGFNNNIIWNLGHMVAAQQGVCYSRAGLKTIVSDDFFHAYKPGTKPEKFVDAAELQLITDLAFSTLVQLETDHANNIFENYTPWTTRYGAELHNIDEAIAFIPFHDGFHMGYVLALRRVISNQ
jgi:hypothetical protein